ncbi:MAG: hypothetical protein M3P49_09485, partial [Actinomycetota bacterium]|nr:hypothetical protein [Actinomycetota bacterium]
MGKTHHLKRRQGSRIGVRLQLRHAQEALIEVGAVFTNESRPEALLEGSGSVRPLDKPAPLSTGGAGWASVADITVQIPPGTDPGVYNLARAWVETAGGRSYTYYPSDLRSVPSFEVVEEPDQKPDISITFT